MLWLLLFLVVLVIFTFVLLRGRNHAFLDTEQPFISSIPASQAHKDVIRKIAAFNGAGTGMKMKDRLQAMRSFMDQLSDGRDFASRFVPVDATGYDGGRVRGEWVLAPNASPQHRLLYIHGGAWMAGSPRSHRTITDRLSRLTGAAVFSLDYRLVPEHRYMDGVKDCRRAYRWILGHGPDGSFPAEQVVVAGDSAGGSHTLGLIAWVRDGHLRNPDAAIALCPSTDLTFTSPSLVTNLPSDPLLGPAFGPLTRIPRPLLWWGTFLVARVRPASPVASPLHGKLHGLPPVLIQASEAEMLVDNARRYTAKARAAGSPVYLQTWPNMVHVWHVFTPELPEAEAAYQKIGQFLTAVMPGPAMEPETTLSSRARQNPGIRSQGFGTANGHPHRIAAADAPLARHTEADR